MRQRIALLGVGLWAATGMVAAGEISGRVTVDDEPASGVSVCAEPHLSPFERALAEARGKAARDDVARTVTDESGRFALEVSSDGARVALRFEAPRVVARRTSRSFDGRLDRDLGEIALDRPRPLAGRVVDAEGASAPGVQVELEAGSWARFGGTSLPLKRRTLTDLDGRFRFEDAGPSRNRLTFRARGYAFEVRSAVKPGVLPQPISLKPGHSLSVVVTDVDGPAEGVLVRFEGDSRSPWAATGDGGRVRLDDLPEGTGRLVVAGAHRGVGETPRFALPRSDPEAIRIELVPGRVVEGVVIDAETRQPIAGALVSLRDREGEQLSETDGDGRYRFGTLLPVSFALEATAEGYARKTDEADARHVDRVELDLALVRPARLSGQVVDETGQPIAAAAGRLRSEAAGLNFFRRRRAFGHPGVRFTTGEDGGFSASELPPGDNQQLVLSHPEYGSTTLGGLNLRAGEETRDIVVVLQRGPSVEGHVTDAEDNPIAGAELTLEHSAQGRRVGARRFVAGGVTDDPKTRSDAAGTFRFGGVTPGDYSLVARAPGYAITRIDPLPLEEGQEPLLLKMPIGGTISGRVIRPDGSGARDVFVTALDGRQMGPGTFNDFGAQTSADGFFYLDNLEAGASHAVQVLGQTGVGPRVAGIVPPAEGIEIEVAGVGRIAGRAVDDSGAPMLEFDVNAEYDNRSGGRFMIRAFGRGQESRVASEDGSFTVEELPVGRYSVVVRANGYREARVSGIEVEENRTTSGVEVRLSRGSLILGSVVDDSGRPVIDADVAATASGQRRRFGPGGAPAARTDTDGAFELTGLAEGPYTVTATHPDYSEASETVTLGEGTAHVLLTLDRGSLLAGTVVAQDQSPLPGARVVLAIEGATREMAFRRGQGAVTDQAGRFRFDHLVEGRYSVQATYREGTSPRVAVALGRSERREDLLVALDAGATINGLVSGLTQSELAMVQIWASGEQRYSATSRVGGDGRFELVGAPVGPLRLHASVGDMMAGDRRNTMLQTIVPEGALDVPVEIVFETGFSLSGIVTRAGQPAARVWVSATGAGASSSSGSAATNSGGRYSIDGLPAGAYRLGSGSFRESIEISGDTVYDIELPTARVSGQVVEAGPQSPLADVQVSAEGAEGGGAGRRGAVVTDSNGSFTIDALVPGPYTLTARRAGFGFESVRLDVEDGATEEVLVELARAEGVGLRVRDGMFGIALLGVNVRALDAANITVFSGSISLDSEGRGEVAGLKPGVYTLVVGSGGYASVTMPGVTAPAAMVDVGLTPGGRLEIQVGPETLAKAPRASLSTPSGIPYRSAFGGDGSFRLNSARRTRDNVAPGSYIFLVDGIPTDTIQIDEGATTLVQLP